MASKLLQRIGVVAVIALIGGSFAALAVVKNRIHVTVAEEEAAAQRGPDPVAVLAADVAALREDVRSLGENVGSQLQALHDALDGAASERAVQLSGDVADLRRELALLHSRVDQQASGAAESSTRLREALASLDQGVRDLAASVAQEARIPVVAAPADLTPAVDHQEGREVELTPAVAAVVPPAPSESTPIPAAAASAPKKSFLSFKLPSQSFVFDQRQRFAIVPSLSRVGFDAKSTLHDFSGVTTRIEGELTTNLARPGESSSGAVRAQASSLDTGLAGRDEAMREILEPDRFPEIRFEWTSFETTLVDAPAQKVTGVAQGTLSIHGVAREIAMPVTVAVDASKRLAIDGQTKIRMSDFGVKPPAKLGVISVEDEATLWIALRARTLGALHEEKP